MRVKQGNNKAMVEELEIDDSCIKIGRGPSTYNHAGNVKFRSIIAKHLASYKAGPKPKKTLIVNMVHQDMSEEGMKFIERKAGVWKKVENIDDLRKKVAHRFRDAIILERKNVIRSRQRLDQPIGPDAENASHSSRRDSSSCTDSSRSTTTEEYIGGESISFTSSSNDEAIPERGVNMLSIRVPTRKASPSEYHAVCGGRSDQHPLGDRNHSEGRQFTTTVSTSSIRKPQVLVQQQFPQEMDGTSSHEDHRLESMVGILPDAGIRNIAAGALAAIFDEVTDLMEAAPLDSDYFQD
mmetsp:Transcript_24224/g.40127  ORF Transcript_24224/g.40127 Transcript_24224/m.40127 type:complete len:295 (+) Transcript_24224:84-968(+)